MTREMASHARFEMFPLYTIYPFLFLQWLLHLIIFAYVGPDRCIASCRTLGSPRSLEFFKVVSLAGIDSSAPQRRKHELHSSSLVFSLQCHGAEEMAGRCLICLY